jgi:hypothetical protein
VTIGARQVRFVAERSRADDFFVLFINCEAIMNSIKKSIRGMNKKEQKKMN